MNITRFIWPWESEVIIQHPWILPIFFLIVSIPLSLISWKRMKQ